MIIEMTKLLNALSLSLDYVENEIIKAARNHGKRVAVLTNLMAKEAGYSQDVLYALTQSAVLHDCALSEYLNDEFSGDNKSLDETNMFEHCVAGEKMMTKLPFYHLVRGTVLFHHERADGKGALGMTDHPVREYLSALQWDGVERVRFALPHFLGTAGTEYEYECLKLFMLGAISRIFKPGCKFEYMLCLVGGQGAGKSTFIRFLCLNDRWFTDDIKRLDDEKVYEHLAGHWICEMAEMLAVLNTKYNEATKAFLSKQYDNYRKPYGMRAEDIPRQCVFAGTSNVINFLPLDRSGNRRFLPIMCDASKAEVHILEDEEASRKYIEQMWAEMMTLYNSGKVRLKLPVEIEKNLIEYQCPFMQEDTWTGLIQEWLDNYSGDIVCVQQIYNEALKEFGKPRNSEAREIGLIMNGTISGWKAYPNPRNIPGYGKQRGWSRVETNSGNKDSGFISVEGTQMEIPFEC